MHTNRCRDNMRLIGGDCSCDARCETLRAEARARGHADGEREGEKRALQLCVIAASSTYGRGGLLDYVKARLAELEKEEK